MRLPKTYKKAIFEEKDFTFSYPDSDKKKQLTLRSIHFPLEDGKTEYLVTNIMQSKLEYSLFKELYCLRWVWKVNTGNSKIVWKLKHSTP